MLPVAVISQAIGRDWRELYEAFWRPEAFPRWAAGLSGTPLRQDGDVWRAAGPGGPVTIRFSPHNPFGIMDHWVDTGPGPLVYVPLRIIADGGDALVQLTLFRQPGIDDAAFARDRALVERDLAKLRDLAEGR